MQAEVQREEGIQNCVKFRECRCDRRERDRNTILSLIC